MVQINFAKREISCKLVYYGPGMSGKTTNLEVIHQKVQADNKGDMVAIATEGDRTLFFDFLPLDLGKVKGMKTKFQLYTVPGQVYYASTRKLVLQGADGVIFVADSQKSKLNENIGSMKDLTDNLAESGIEVDSFPMVIQWNKRDLPSAAKVAWLEEKINRLKAPATEAVAANGEGVMGTLKLLAKMVLDRFNEQGGTAASGTSKQTAGGQKKEESTLATINGDKISRSYFSNYCQTQYRLNSKGEVEDFKKMSKQEKLGYMQNLTNHALLMQTAKKKGFVIDKKQLSAQINRFIGKFGSREKFDRFLQQRRLTMDNIKNEAVKSIVVNAMAKMRNPDIAEKLKVTREEVSDYYASHSDSFSGGLQQHELRIIAILKNKKKKSLLKKLYDELRSESKITLFEDKL